jgi:hypothetical protein
MPRTPSPAADDDAALRWDDVDDPTYVDVEPLGGELLTGESLAGEPLEATPAGSAAGARDAGAAAGRTRAASVALAVAGGVVAVTYTIAWVIGVERLPLSGPTLVLEVIYQFAEFLAIIASFVWVMTTIVLTRDRPAVRAGWLALGTLLLMPWPVVLGVIA